MSKEDLERMKALEEKRDNCTITEIEEKELTYLIWKYTNQDLEVIIWQQGHWIIAVWLLHTGDRDNTTASVRDTVRTMQMMNRVRYAKGVGCTISMQSQIINHPGGHYEGFSKVA